MRVMLQTLALCLFISAVSIAGGVHCEFNGVAGPAIEYTYPDSLMWGDMVIGEIQTKPWTIKNAAAPGSALLRGDLWHGEGCDSAFSIVGGETTYAIAPGESLIVVVECEPDHLGVGICRIECGERSVP